MGQLSDKERAELLEQDVITLRTHILLYRSHIERLDGLRAVLGETYTSKMSVSYGIESVMPKGDSGERVDPLDAYIDRKEKLKERANVVESKIRLVDDMLSFAYVQENGKAEPTLVINPDDMELIRHIMDGYSMRQFAFKKKWSPNTPQYRFKRAVRQIAELRFVRLHGEQEWPIV